MDDPFTTPNKHQRDNPDPLDSPSILMRPSTSPTQLKRTLQAHLAETRKRLEGAGQLGRDLVKQEEEIETRLREVSASGGKIDPELKRKLAELEKEYNSVGRETARALLTNKIMSTGAASPGGSNVRPVFVLWTERTDACCSCRNIRPNLKAHRRLPRWAPPPRGDRGTNRRNSMT